ncbi:DUF58 domain-containing protein [Leucobacter sp. G161]|uniref:DUF58 domain-containing protein n=1 Tax=Leucobacter sp. G161 TaxID=663704 RepID=UPI00073C248B|nr:DUF58 domain-containing protein [Leucobacter sp. G161]KUF07147.1 hypothetical protein AUL38_02295 [Leucobacter sp. G161]
MTSQGKQPRKQSRRLPLTLTARGVFVLLSAVVLGAGWRLLGLHGLSVFCFFFAASLLLAVIIVTVGSRVPPAAQRGRILRPESSTATVGEPHTVHPSLAARRGPAAVVAAEWEVNDYLGETRRSTTRTPAALTVAHHSRGPATVCLLAVLFEDPLGLARRRIRIDERAEILVLPRLLTGDHRSPSLEAPGAGGTQQQTVAREQRGLPGGDVREYQAGDPVRQIHWKQSARQRELLIRLPEQDPQVAVDLRLRTDPVAYESAESFEHAVSVAATEGLRRIRAGNPVRLLTSAADPQLCTTAPQLMRALAFVRLDDPEAAAHA